MRFTSSTQIKATAAFENDIKFNGINSVSRLDITVGTPLIPAVMYLSLGVAPDAEEMDSDRYGEPLAPDGSINIGYEFGFDRITAPRFLSAIAWLIDESVGTDERKYEYIVNPTSVFSKADQDLSIAIERSFKHLTIRVLNDATGVALAFKFDLQTQDKRDLLNAVQQLKSAVMSNLNVNPVQD